MVYFILGDRPILLTGTPRQLGMLWRCWPSERWRVVAKVEGDEETAREWEERLWGAYPVEPHGLWRDVPASAVPAAMAQVRAASLPLDGTEDRRLALPPPRPPAPRLVPASSGLKGRVRRPK